MGIEKLLVYLHGQGVALVEEDVEHWQSIVRHHAFEVVPAEAMSALRSLCLCDAAVVGLVNRLERVDILAHDGVCYVVEAVVPVTVGIASGVMVIEEHLQGGIPKTFTSRSGKRTLRSLTPHPNSSWVKGMM